MARIPIYEYKAKKLLDPEYLGCEVISGDELPEVEDGLYAVKVDQGVKQRGVRGLLRLGVSKDAIAGSIEELQSSGYSHFLVEKMTEHAPDEERFLSLARERVGFSLIYCAKGGVNIEESKDAVEKVLWEYGAPAPSVGDIPTAYVEHLREIMNSLHVSFLEINPLIIKDGRPLALDCAIKVDSAGSYAVRSQWSFDDVPARVKVSEAEERVRELDQNTPASLKLNVLNENGSLFFLFSSGGASIVLADDAYVRGLGEEIGNYGEYSGAPTRTETYLYAREIIGLMQKSGAKKKALVIAGGVANFTDVKETFSGIIDALEEVKDELKNDNVKVFVRRGGPREDEGLALMRKFLEDNQIFGSVHGSDTLLTEPIKLASEYLKA